MIAVILEIAAMAALFGIDQAIKAWATANLAPVGTMPLIPGIVRLNYVLNQGMAFSLLSGKQTFLIIVTGLALLLLLYYLFTRCKGRIMAQISIVIIISGGLGNLYDRIMNGQVVDYLDLQFMNFAVFNFADICVCVGMGLLILCIFLEESKGNKKGKKADE